MVSPQCVCSYVSQDNIFMRKSLLNRYMYVAYPKCVPIKTTFSGKKLWHRMHWCHLISVYYPVLLEISLLRNYYKNAYIYIVSPQCFLWKGFFPFYHIRWLQDNSFVKSYATLATLIRVLTNMKEVFTQRLQWYGLLLLCLLV